MSMTKTAKARLIFILFIIVTAIFPVTDPFGKCPEKETSQLRFLKNPFVVASVALILAWGVKPSHYRMAGYSMFLAAIITNGYFHFPIVQAVFIPKEDENSLIALIALLFYTIGTFLYTWLHAITSYQLFALTEYRSD